jgi:hypothetical protein
MTCAEKYFFEMEVQEIQKTYSDTRIDLHTLTLKQDYLQDPLWPFATSP